MKLFPTLIRKGTTVRVSIPSTSLYNSSTYSLKLLLRSGTHITTLADADSSGGWTLTLQASTTSELATGKFSYDIRVESLSDNDVFTYESGLVSVLPSATDSDASMAKSNNERMLEKVNIAIDKCLEDGLSEYAIADRSAKKIPLAELLKLQRELIILVQREQKAGQSGKLFKIATPRYL